MNTLNFENHPTSSEFTQSYDVQSIPLPNSPSFIKRTGIMLTAGMLFFMLFLFSAGTASAQSRAANLKTARQIEARLDNLDPSVKTNRDLMEYLDGITDAVKECNLSDFEIQQCLKDIKGVLLKAEKGRCSGADCVKAKNRASQLGVRG